MIPEKAFERLLGLDEGWEVAAAEYETEPVERFMLVIRKAGKKGAFIGTVILLCYA